jgi:hypothetical protein
MTVTFQVGDREFGGSGNLEIDFWVRPLKLELWLDIYFDCLEAIGQWTGSISN